MEEECLLFFNKIKCLKFRQRRAKFKIPIAKSKIFTVFLLNVLIGILSGCPSPPPSPLNSRLIDGKIICDEGFTIFGDPVPECLKEGDYKLPTCAKAISRYSSLEKSCVSTTKESNPSFRLDLLSPILINYIRLQFGGETTGLDVEVRAGNNSVAAGKNPICKWETGPMNETIQCSRPIVAQYIFVQMVGEGVLQLCDIQPFSTHDPSRCRPPTVAGEIVSYNSTCYEIVSSGQTYPAASAQCTSRKGSLLSANYPLAILKDKLENLKSIRPLYWIGVERDKGFTSRTWRWTATSEIVKKPPWGKDQPNNYNREQNCVVLDGQREWGWNDVGCNLDMIGFICEFRATSCPSPDRRELSSYEPSPTYKIGQKITYTCPEGHFVLGATTRECLPNSKWSHSAPSCKFIDCGSYENSLENGEIIAPNRTSFGATIKYACNDKYTLVGVKERNCGSDGKWSSNSPKCLLSTCPTPLPLINGTVSTTGLVPNSFANYSCNSGSILIGSRVSTCKLGGDWEPPAPSCQYVQCGELPRIMNGKLVSSGWELNAEAHVECDEGYWSEGDEALVCAPDSKWKGSGGCVAITCPEPGVPTGGFITGYDFSLHSEITYHCEEGHLLIGGSTRKCRNNGEWSGLAPSCKYIDCGRAPTIPHGQLSYQSTTLGSTIKYSCAPNYKLNGDHLRVCVEDGAWSGVSPKCEEIRCGEPELPSNSIISVTLNDRSSTRSLITSPGASKSTFKLGAVIKYRCERGYKMNGESTRTCVDGEWSGKSPSCTFVDCGEPHSIVNGKYELITNTTFLTSTAGYECDSGWKLVGKSRVVCNEDGKWSGSASCEEIFCDKLESENILVTKFRPGGVATYSCPRGSELLGNSTRICLESGEWSGAEPKCRAMPCPAPPPTPNARIFPLNTSLSGSGAVEYHCVPGFTLIGSAILSCFQAAWSPPSPPDCVLASKSSALPVVLGSSFGVLLVLLLTVGFLYLRHIVRGNKEGREAAERGSSGRSSTRKEGSGTPMVLFEPHYYDNPTPDEHIYEDLGERNSVVTINGVAVG